jgi:hypothetical protein
LFFNFSHVHKLPLALWERAGVRDLPWRDRCSVETPSPLPLSQRERGKALKQHLPLTAPLQKGEEDLKILNLTGGVKALKGRG